MKRMLSLVFCFVLILTIVYASPLKLQLDSGQPLEKQFEVFREYLRGLSEDDQKAWISEFGITISDEAQQASSLPVEAISLGMKNALRSAESYLSFTAFSHVGLVRQLEFEGYTNEEATYAADNCGADWNEQAAKSAKNYLSFTSFSKKGLIQQLEFEGFTTSQAEYGAKQNGY